MKTVASFLKKTGSPPDPTEIERLSDLCKTAPLFYRNLGATAWAGSEMQERHKRAYLAGLSIAEAQIRETLGLVSQLGLKGIKSVVLKGPITADLLLGDPGLYQSSDIDFLIRPEDMPGALELLEAQGYRRISSMSLKDEMACSYHVTISKGIYHIELHWNLVMRYFAADPEYWWKDVPAMEYRGHSVLQLQKEQFFLYLIFRLFAKGFRPLKYFVFPLAYVSGKDVGFDWDLFMRHARQLRMERLALFTLNLFHDMFLPAIPETIRSRRLMGCGMLRRMVIEGIFKPRINTHVRMVIFLSLLDSPVDVFRVLLQRLFPSPAEIRLRYNIPPGSLKLLPYYLLNPFLMLFKKNPR